ncbi:potassium voltage-gated channel subfamily E regulatory beta subunit 5 [Falco biarmicus]|uniref:potassium voltage-gated channel subfamily E regulatory beta subunit 5 n=2 Tax=Falco TaxID=8952 RepID=UPI0018867A05|nr:potassium voltage-gated channel subfamily E regulatory beta subunit 5 [Falco rusticolus]XP_055583728.1 potassium voltage-gated channel subfamily E regulatory beta subunit 5 [Falco cherrug]XP_055674314.1 potassium voltage-gated channel subfamily E regulatory beta subunit 5 [Falco peregrinus]XP_056216050.1 potassium voltage-gated channel subfamily E regulatory beta subunit 5 [Falco biarmicus]
MQGSGACAPSTDSARLPRTLQLGLRRRRGGGRAPGAAAEPPGVPRGSAAMNCSEPRRLPALLSALLRDLRGSGRNASAGAGGDASLYILLIMVFYGCLAGGLILAYTRSRKLESKHDPYHLYIQRDWGRGGPGQPAEGGGPAAGQRLV